MAKSKDILKATSNAELLSYIINTTPELAAEIDLPKQGESIKEIGKLIIDNQRYRNAFINTINLIGLTVIKRNGWDDPWNFTERGMLRYGQQIREIIVDLVNVYDYNAEFGNKTKFLETEVPNVFNYIHELNFQKFYAVTTSDNQLRMAFESEGGLFDFIDEALSMLFESYVYDKYQVNKYMLARRLLDGTVTPSYISGYANLTPRQRVSAMKSVSNKFTFRSPNYNPAGVRRATKFDNQILIVNTDFEADFSTDVMATSYFRDEADMRARLVLVDGFGNLDESRLVEVLGSAFIPLTETEAAALDAVPAVLISREWFMNYTYALDNASGEKYTEFYNPTTLENHHFMHVWKVFSTSPFENATVFESIEPGVTAVTISPSTATVTPGQTLQFSAAVTATGFANKAVLWSVDDTAAAAGVTISASGLLTVPADYSGSDITVTATSIYDSTVSGTATVTV